MQRSHARVLKFCINLQLFDMQIGKMMINWLNKWAKKKYPQSAKSLERVTQWPITMTSKLLTGKWLSSLPGFSLPSFVCLFYLISGLVFFLSVAELSCFLFKKGKTARADLGLTFFQPHLSLFIGAGFKYFI